MKELIDKYVSDVKASRTIDIKFNALRNMSDFKITNADGKEVDATKEELEWILNTIKKYNNE